MIEQLSGVKEKFLRFAGFETNRELGISMPDHEPSCIRPPR